MSPMKLLRTLRVAIRALRRNVMRSALTTLGIVIGVSAVIAMTDIGQGSSAAVQRTMASMGANNLYVQPGTASSGGVTFGSGSVQTLTPEDAEAIRRECPAVSGVAPIVRVRTQVVNGNRNWVPSYIYGTTPEFLDIRDWTDLPDGAKRYVQRLSELIGCEIGIVSTSPDRDDTILRRDSAVASWFA